MAQAAQSGMTLDAFLAWEDRQERRHEFLGGDIVAMTGGTAAHNLIVQNTAATLRRGLAGHCGIFTESMRVIAPTGDVSYPDVVATCAAWSLKDSVVAEPLVIVEVLSDSTERADRGRKWFAYQVIPSLRHYLLLSQDAPSLELYSRSDGGVWRYAHTEGLGAAIDLDSLAVSLPLEDLFRGALAA
ncbi:MAG: Uma2 family endonuclease [Alphaproteobacteria bacterium]|nr:Uma2 family endonuclease [Alphaproteobacteria bacterium]